MDLRERGSTGSRHPWELARIRALKRIVRRVHPSPRATVLDVGTGDGFALSALFPTGTGLDPNFDADQLAELRRRHPGARWVRSLDELDGERFDGALFLDVLEHVEDDVGLIAEIADRALRADSWAIATVPAFQGLFTAHDTFLAHHRRYTRRQLVDALTAGGLHVQECGYLFTSLLAPRAAQRVLEAVRGPGSTMGIGDWGGGPVLTRVIERLLSADARLGLKLQRLGLTLPGLSVWATCRRS